MTMDALITVTAQDLADSFRDVRDDLLDVQRDLAQDQAQDQGQAFEDQQRTGDADTAAVVAVTARELVAAVAEGHDKAFLDTFALLADLVSQANVSSEDAAGLDIIAQARLNNAAVRFIRAGAAWAGEVVRTRAIPPKMHKSVEMAARTLHRSRLPKDLPGWFTKNQKRWDLLQAATSWPLKDDVPTGDGGDDGDSDAPKREDVFPVAGFEVHNTVGATGKALRDLQDIVTQAAAAARGSQVPGMAETVRGELYLVGQIKARNWAAWYVPADDRVYLRKPHGVSVEECARHLVHELTHRLWHKSLPDDVKKAWARHHGKLSASEPTEVDPSEGEVIEGLLVGNKRVIRGPRKDTGIEVLNAKTGDSLGVVSFLQWHKWMRDLGHRAKFPSPYAQQDPEEHFCEAVSLAAFGQLTPEHQQALTQALSQARTAQAEGEPDLGYIEAALKVESKHGTIADLFRAEPLPPHEFIDRWARASTREPWEAFGEDERPTHLTFQFTAYGADELPPIRTQQPAEADAWLQAAGLPVTPPIAERVSEVQAFLDEVIRHHQEYEQRERATQQLTQQGVTPEQAIDGWAELQDAIVFADRQDDVHAFVKDALTHKPNAFMTAQAITLFTNGNVPAVRDPGTYDAVLARSRIRNKTLGLSTQPTNEAYVQAHSVMRALAAQPRDPVKNDFDTPIYRGLALPKESADALDVGDVLDLGAVSSWTTAERRAQGWAIDRVPVRQTDEKVAVVLVLDDPQWGTDIARLSAFPDEAEVVIGGQVKVTGIITDEVQPSGVHLLVLRVEQVKANKTAAVTAETQLMLSQELDQRMRRPDTDAGAVAVVTAAQVLAQVDGELTKEDVANALRHGLEMHHGSPPGVSSSSFVTDPGFYGRGKYWTTGRDIAKYYAHGADEGVESRGLRASNPLVLTIDEAKALADQYGTREQVTHENRYDLVDAAQRLTDDLTARGHDSVAIIHKPSSMTGLPNVEVVVLSQGGARVAQVEALPPPAVSSFESVGTLDDLIRALGTDLYHARGDSDDDRAGQLRVQYADLPADLRRVIDAVALFTSGEWWRISQTPPSRARAEDETGREVEGPRDATGEPIVLAPSDADYQQAAELLASMAQAPLTLSIPIYRGLGLDHVPEPGEVIDLGPATSWTANRDMAEDFARGKDWQDHRQGDVPVVLVLPEPKRGTDIAPVSAWADESEVVTSGKVRVTHLESDKQHGGTRWVYVEQLPLGRHAQSQSDEAAELRAEVEAVLADWRARYLAAGGDLEWGASIPDENGARHVLQTSWPQVERGMRYVQKREGLSDAEFLRAWLENARTEVEPLLQAFEQGAQKRHEENAQAVQEEALNAQGAEVDNLEELPEDGQVWAWHGTSDVFRDAILQQGISPQSETGIASNYANVTEGVFLSLRPDVSFYARAAVAKHGGEPMTVQVLVDVADLQPDPDDEDIGPGRWQVITGRIAPGQIAKIDDEWVPSFVRQHARQATVEQDALPGGLSDEAHDRDFDPDALAAGIEVELEHTTDPALAKEIAQDHLTEDPEYYTKLREMEHGARTAAKVEDLVVIHGLSARSLRHADQVGGLIAPSLAVTRRGLSFDRYGELVLVAPLSMADPKTTPVFDADIYSPRYPRVEYDVNQKALRGIEQMLRPYAEQLGMGGSVSALDQYLGEPDSLEDLSNRQSTAPFLQLAFLSEVKGQTPDITAVESPRRLNNEWVRSPHFEQFFDARGFMRQPETDEEYWAAISEAARQSIQQYWEQAIPGDDPEMVEIRQELIEEAAKRTFDKEQRMKPHKWRPIHRDYLDRNQVDRDVRGVRDSLKEAIKPFEAEYKDWVEQLFQPTVGKAYIKAPGSKRRITYTPENVLKVMNRGKTRGGEGFDYGLGNVRAQGAKQFRSLNTMAQAADNIVDADTFETAKRELEQRSYELAQALSQSAGHNGREQLASLPNLMDALQDMAKPRGRVPASRALATNGFGDVTPELAQEAQGLLRDTLSAPTTYFEAKPKRIVPLSEFVGIAMPDDAPTDLHQLAAKHGLQVEVYPAGSDNSAAIEKLARLGRQARSDTTVRRTKVSSDETPKDFIEWRGLTIQLEWLGGETRYPDSPWPQFIPEEWLGYGYIEGISAPDGDSFDVICGAAPFAAVYLVEQRDKETGTHLQWKVILGASDETAARAMFCDMWPPEMQGRLLVMSPETFKEQLVPLLKQAVFDEHLAHRRRLDAELTRDLCLRGAIAEHLFSAFDVPGVTPPEQKIAAAQSSRDGRLAHAEDCSDFFLRPALTVALNSSVETPSQTPLVLARVLATTHDLQIGEFVVEAISVDVMHDFVRFQSAPEMPLHDDTVLQIVAPTTFIEHEAVRRGPSSETVDEGVSDLSRTAHAQRHTTISYVYPGLVVHTARGMRSPRKGVLLTRSRQDLQINPAGFGTAFSPVVYLAATASTVTPMLGFESEAAAAQGFRMLWPAEMFGGIIRVPVEKFVETVMPNFVVDDQDAPAASSAQGKEKGAQGAEDAADTSDGNDEASHGDTAPSPEQPARQVVLLRQAANVVGQPCPHCGEVMTDTTVFGRDDRYFHRPCVSKGPVGGDSDSDSDTREASLRSRLPSRDALWRALLNEAGAGYPADFVAADAAYRAWSHQYARNRGPKPVYEGGETDAINQWLGLEGDRRVSGPYEGFQLLLRGARTWEDLVNSDVLRILQEVPGLEGLRLPTALYEEQMALEEAAWLAEQEQEQEQVDESALSPEEEAALDDDAFDFPSLTAAILSSGRVEVRLAQAAARTASPKLVVRAQDLDQAPGERTARSGFVYVKVPQALARMWPPELTAKNGPPHATLVYLPGPLDAEARETVQAIVAEAAARTAPFPVELSKGVSWFTSDNPETQAKGEAEIAHKGVHPKTVERLAALHWDLVGELEAAGLKPAVRDEYKAHLTLGYCPTRSYSGPVPEGGWTADAIWVDFSFDAAADNEVPSDDAKETASYLMAGAKPAGGAGDRWRDLAQEGEAGVFRMARLLKQALRGSKMSVTAACMTIDLNPPGTFSPSRRKQKQWVGETYYIRDSDGRCTVAYATPDQVPCRNGTPGDLDSGDDVKSVRLKPDAKVLREGDDDWLKLFDGGGLPALVDVVRKAVEGGYDAVRIGEALAILSGVALADQDDELKRKRRQQREKQRGGWMRA